MKFLIGLLMPLALFAQQEPPKGANAIAIATTLSDSLLYEKAGQVLIENGYTIGRSDKDSLRIQAETRKLKDINIYPYLTISISEGRATVTGFFGSTFDRLSDPANELTRITNRGGNESPIKAAFDLMKEYAQKLTEYTGGSLTFTSRP